MKNFLLVLVVLSMLSTSLIAQNDVQLNIRHLLGDADFALNAAVQNNLGHDFKTTRLEYYISEITITHDGGMETTIEDLWILTNASEVTEVDLGNHNINTAEKISFYIGVDEAHNHLDPAQYPSTHPLAPQLPSMHWGWAGGYRFVAFEGEGGSNFNQTIELHGLGDENYFLTEVPVDFTVNEDNELIISLDADYTRALENIEMTAGAIVHGGYGDAKKCLENFRDYVFTMTAKTTSIVDFSEVNDFSVYPNPAEGGDFTINLETEDILIYQISVTDMLGKQVAYFDEVNANAAINVQVDEAGFYMINLIKEGQPIITRKLIAK